MSTESQPLVGALDEPTVNVRRGYIGAVFLANFGIVLAFFTPIQNLLPRLAEVADPANKEGALAWIAGAGAAASIVFNPLAGALSDRTTSRLGRRRPWVLWGSIAGACGIAALAFSSTVLGLACIWFFCQATINGSYAAVTATIPDQVPVPQRGLVSGWVGLASTLGVVVGVALVSFVVPDLKAGILLTAVLLVVLCLPFALGLKDIVLDASQRPEFHLWTWLGGFWVSPRLYPDFGWAWLTRFLMMLGNSMATLYLLFWLKDEVHYENPDQGQTVLIGLYALGTMATAVIFERLSDRSGRRKIYVIVSTVVMAVAAVLLAFFPVFDAAMVAALILGLGYGMYLSVDQALVTQVLPRAIDRGRDLGVINIANSAPQVLAPVIALPLVKGASGYTGLYLATAAITLLSAVLVTRIRSVP
ncbi:MAG TPA: MFS transporter [Candidatus Nanopelagicales bacterium]|nr:MFS transporter [Candidatus Nanopelagicales bacterium]